jgi:hypothetical protein
MKNEPNIGQLTTPNANRDAIHVAIIPVISDEVLSAGAHVGVVSMSSMGVKVSRNAKTKIGIIDPFLKELYTSKNSACWLFLYPKTVTNLRHDWSHPDLDKENFVNKSTQKEISQNWLWDYARRHDNYNSPRVAYETLIDNAYNGDIVYQGHDLHSIDELDSAEELMFHLSVVLGKKVTLDDFNYGCSC